MKEDENDLYLLKSQIRKVNLDLDKKNQEINTYLEKIHDNEEELMELNELISKADNNLYRAKDSGRNRSVCD